MSDPVADELVGEVWPSRIQEIGTAGEYSYFIRPSFTRTVQGFDEIRIEATAGTEMELLEVRTGSDADFLNEGTTDYAPVELAVRDTPADTLEFRLPGKVGRGTDLVEIRFRATLFGNSASFRGLVQNSAAPGFWQRIDEGDPTELVGSQTVTVLALGGNEIIKNFRTDSQVVTPNGDGANDELIFSFAITRVNTEKPVTLKVYDLTGTVVREIVERPPDPRGRYVFRWDGRGEGGETVPPGIYLVRIEVEADDESAGNRSIQRVIYVAY